MDGVDKMGIEFNSVEELYRRIRPALVSKVREFNRNGVTFVKEEDIWNYLIDFKWKTGKGLELFNIVDDVLNTDNSEIEKYVIDKMKNIERKANLEKIDFN